MEGIAGRLLPDRQKGKSGTSFLLVERLMCTEKDLFHISSTASASLTRNDKVKGMRDSEVCTDGTIRMDIRNASIQTYWK